MAIPWFLALKALPWGTILANAPSILRSADALRARTRPEPGADSDAVRTLADRIAALEQRDRETAEVIAQISTQLTQLTTVGEVLEARARWLLVVAAAALIVAVLAGAVALLSR